MNVVEFKHHFKKELSVPYTKDEIDACLEELNLWYVFDLLCETGLSYMVTVREHVSEKLITLQAKEEEQKRTIRWAEINRFERNREDE
jgi:hypothetical protein